MDRPPDRPPDARFSGDGGRNSGTTPGVSLDVLHGPPLGAAPFATLAAAIEALGEDDRPWLHVHHGTTTDTWTGAALVAEARGWAGALAEAGVVPGQRVALLFPNEARFVAALFGTLLAGAAAVPLPWPVVAAGTPHALDAARATLTACRPAALCTIPALTELGPAVTAPAVPGARPGVRPEDPAIIQYTSGSLGRPRGAVLEHRAVVASAWAMGRALALDGSDRCVSWLPLFHDMGLVGGLLCPALHGFGVHLMSPGEFLLHPGRWFRCIAEHRATVTAAPDFAWRLAARRVREPFDLRCLRHALDGAEPVHRATLDAVEARFGVRVSPVYGLAENTLGVAFGRPGEPDLLDGGRRVVSVGAPLPGTDLAVDDRGEILVRGPATMRGYLHDPEGTDGALADGWLHTGDLGRIDGGRLYVTGREKDLVIQYGRKFHPYEVERFAAEAAGSPPNGAAAFSLDATAEVVVVVETRREGAAGAVRGVLLERLGVRPDRVVCVAPGELPRTTSGKVRRAEAAARFGAAS